MLICYSCNKKLIHLTFEIGVYFSQCCFLRHKLWHFSLQVHLEWVLPPLCGLPPPCLPVCGHWESPWDPRAWPSNSVSIPTVIPVSSQSQSPDQGTAWPELRSLPPSTTATVSEQQLGLLLAPSTCWKPDPDLSCVQKAPTVCVCVCVCMCVYVCVCMYVLSHSVVSNSLQPHEL